MIEDGMITGESIKNKYGQVMLAENIRLESKHQKMLKMWGISSIFIMSDDEVQSEIYHDPETIEKAEEIIKEKILWTPINKFDEEIYQIVMDRILETQYS